MSNFNRTTRRSVLSTVATAGGIAIAGCSTIEEESYPELDEQGSSEEELDEQEYLEFPKLNKWEPEWDSFSQTVVLEFELTPYQHEITLETYTHLPTSAPEKEETVTLHTITEDFTDNPVESGDSGRVYRFEIDTNKLVSTRFHRFLIRATNVDTNNSKILADSNAVRIYKNPQTDETYVYRRDSPTQITSGRVTYRPLYYSYTVPETSYYQNDVVDVANYLHENFEGLEERTGIFEASFSEEEAKFGDFLYDKFVEEEFYPYNSLGYETEVDASDWDFIDQDSGTYTYKISESKQVTDVVEHLNDLEKSLGEGYELNTFAELYVVFDIFKTFRYESANFNDSWEKTLQPAGLWSRGAGDCLDLSVSLAAVLYNLGYELGLTYQYGEIDTPHSCIVVKLPKEVIESQFPDHFQQRFTGEEKSQQYFRESEDFAWIYLDATEDEFGETIPGYKTYDMFEKTIREGTNELYN